MEATVRLLDKEPTVAVQVLWRGAEMNLLRAKEEPVERFLQRLGLSCGKLVGKQGGGDKKRAKKEKKKPVAATDAAENQAEAEASVPQNSGISPALLDATGARVVVGTPVAEALQKATHLEIEGDRLPILVNPPSIQKLEVFGRPLAGCALVASMRCEFCDPSAFKLRWLRQAAAGAQLEGQEVGEGSILWVPEDAVGQSLTLRADAVEGSACGRAKAIVRIGLVEQVPPGWADERLLALGARSSTAMRVVCYNILAPQYSRSQTAARDMYPYCPPHALDYAYRQPLLGRDLTRLDGDIVCLQECSFATYRKFLVPVFGSRYTVRLTMKASQIPEGCAMMLRKEAFEVLEERDALFRNLLRTSKGARAVLREVSAKWPDFLQNILPRMSTVFQLSAVRHSASGAVLIVANTHLFFHPLARHIRLLQAMCLLQQVAELRERHRQEDGSLPRVILCGDLNCLPETGALSLLLKGEVSSEHPDWEQSTQFAWRDEEESLADAGEDDDGEDRRGAAPSLEVDAGDEVEPLPEAEWQPGPGVCLRNPLGTLTDAYADNPMPFTNIVRDFTGTLDYIMTSGGFKVARTLSGPSAADVEPHGGLPSVSHPSDHLSLAADLELLPA